MQLITSTQAKILYIFLRFAPPPPPPVDLPPSYRCLISSLHAARLHSFITYTFHPARYVVIYVVSFRVVHCVCEAVTPALRLRSVHGTVQSAESCQ